MYRQNNTLTTCKPRFFYFQYITKNMPEKALSVKLFLVSQTTNKEQVTKKKQKRAGEN